MAIIVLDTEFCNTTKYSDGKFPHNSRGIEISREIVEIGAVKLDDELNVIDKLQLYVQPVNTQFINKNLEELIGVTYAELKRIGIKYKKAFSLFCEFVGENAVVLTWDTEDESVIRNNCEYYNIKMLDADFEDLQALCGQVMFPEVEQKLKVESALELLAMEPEGQLHEALSDAINEARIFRAIPNAVAALDTYNPFFYSTGCKTEANIFSYNSEKEYDAILARRELSSKENDKEYGKILVPRFMKNKVYYKVFKNRKGQITIEKVKNRKDKKLLIAYSEVFSDENDAEVLKVLEWYKKYLEK